MQEVLKLAAAHMWSDQGLQVPAGYELPVVNDADEYIDWERVARFLETLNTQELEAFCIGEQEEMDAIKGRSLDSYYAHRAMDMVFCDVMGIE